ncbi:MAG TPA: malto-oligosyltrehalose synthase [Thermoanaerobaculia bacterium]|nr:malto-oligosyltrehalose synthase [Thermoanaerobaculia bacterium]
MRIRTPLSTYRVQFNSSFSFADATRILPYLHDLGVTDLYGSPILKARPGSQHGYDVVDAAALNPELGSAEDLASFSAEMKRLDFGFLLDIVPNHMAASSDNEWWMSLLENGPQSRYSNYFDIDLEEFSTTGAEKILLPVLGKPYGEVLELGELKVQFDQRGFFITYFDRRFPVAPHSYSALLNDCVNHINDEKELLDSTERELRELIEATGIAPPGSTTTPKSFNSRFLKETLWRLHASDPALGRLIASTLERINGTPQDPSTFENLDHLLDEQWYRLAYWRLASEGINYRRFFDITDLIGVRIEEPEVFEARNARVFKLIDDGIVTGLRIDHIDGLYDPVAHLIKLQSRINTQPGQTFHVVVEKILGAGETLPEEFQASGTTGYEFLNQVNDVFVSGEGLKKLNTIYRSVTGRSETYGQISYERKRRVIQELFPGEIRRLSKRLLEIASHDRHARDFTPGEILDALIDVTASLQVYRTYIRDSTVSLRDRHYLEEAFKVADLNRRHPIDRRVSEFVRRVLLLEVPSYAAGRKAEWLDFVMRWQQFTGRVMAKGVEDTSFYIYNRLISLNEVGGEPDRDLSDNVERFHQENAARTSLWPRTLSASSTHDTKRSEDFRARLNVLSELPDEWKRSVRRWSRLNRHLRVQSPAGSEGASEQPAAKSDGAPDANEEFLIYQTLLGVWPLDLNEEEGLAARLEPWIEKSLREAKERSNWIEPNLSYEEAVKRYVRQVIAPENSRFLDDFRPFQSLLAFYGAINALSQLLLKITSPGIPDFYRGTELWDFSLVDPDNRRPVDFERRRKILASITFSSDRSALIRELLRTWKDGRIKLFVTHTALQLRKAQPELFQSGHYIPLQTSGTRLSHVCAFGRVRYEPSEARSDATAKPTHVITAVPRLSRSLVKRNQFPLGDVWRGNHLALPDNWPQRWINAFTGEILTAGPSGLALNDAFRSFPLLLLVSSDDANPAQETKRPERPNPSPEGEGGAPAPGEGAGTY